MGKNKSRSVYMQPSLVSTGSHPMAPDASKPGRGAGKPSGSKPRMNCDIDFGAS